MPMDFPDMKSLIRHGEMVKCPPKEGEDEAVYRARLANFMASIDFIESQEIRFGKGWDKWNEQEKLDTLGRKFSGRDRMRLREE